MKTKSIVKMGLAGLVALALQSCNNGTGSQIDGHYEESSAAEMEYFRGGQVAVPEYAPSTSVIMGMPAIDVFDKEDLVDAILAAGADTVYITTGSRSRVSTQDASFRNLRQKLGSRIDRVKVVRQAAQGGLTVWARDWAPLGARSIGQGPEDLRLVDFNYYPRRQADDATARAIETVYSLDRVSVPVYNEGGNFMNNDRGSLYDDESSHPSQ